jgi:hypothetical protein
MRFTRGSLTLPRMNAHRMVVLAAALTVIVASALATALAVFSGQALPHAIRHDLNAAAGTSILITGNVNSAAGAQYTSILPGMISSALNGTRFSFARGYWSDPLGFVPGSRPATPASAGNQPIAEAAALGGLTAQATLTSGHWPGAPAAGQPIPAALPATAAGLLHVSTGDTLRMKDRISGHDVRFVITGLYRPRQVSAPYWALDLIALSGSSTASGFTTYGPLDVSAAAFSGPLATYEGSWLAQPQTGSIPPGQLTTVAGNVSQLRQTLAGAEQLPDLSLATSLPSVLTGTASDLDVARSLLAICAVLLFLLAGAALLAVTRLLAVVRLGETAMLTARGATRWQLVRLAAVEAVPLAIAAAAAGAVAGVLLARLLAGGTTGSGIGIASGIASAAVAAALVAAGTVVIMVVPVVGTASPGAARSRRGRQGAVPAITRAGADLALIALAVLAGWELHRYSAVSPGTSGNYGVDPVIVAAPALALAGGTVLALRLLPAAGKTGDALAARGRRLTAAMASWQISRQPIRQGGAALLIVLAVATGTLALSQRQSWTRSAHDQAAFTTGADIRIQTSQPLTPAQTATVTHQPGITHATPTATFIQNSTGSQTIALDAAQAAHTLLLRPDQTALPPAALLAKITPAHRAAGVTLGRSALVRLTARLGPASLGLAPVSVGLSVEDADGEVFALYAGLLAADGRDHTLTASLGQRGAIYPLRLTAISVDYTMPARPPRGPAAFTVDSVSGGPGTAGVTGAVLSGWPAAATSAELQGVRQVAQGTDGPSGLPAASTPAVAGGAATTTFATGYGLAASGLPGVPPSSLEGQLQLTATRPPAAIPGIATRNFLATSHAGIGSIVQTDINGAMVSVKIVATVASFPTVSATAGALVVDLGSLQDILNGAGLAPAQVSQWWLASSSGVPPGLAAALPPGSAITSTGGVTARLLGNPLSTVPQQALLAVAVAAAVLAITGFCVSIAAGVRLRRAENALLAALGVPPRSAAGQLCLEKLMLSLPAALCGLILGVVLAEFLVPAITLTPAATAPVPPVLIEFGWAQTLPLALAVAVLPVLAAALTIARRPDAAAELRASESA